MDLLREKGKMRWPDNKRKVKIRAEDGQPPARLAGSIGLPKSTGYNGFVAAMDGCLPASRSSGHSLMYAFGVVTGVFPYRGELVEKRAFWGQRRDKLPA